MSLPNPARRSALVYRINGGTSVVQASAIRDYEELTYALSFLAHHRLYKMSKGNDVNVANATEVMNAMQDAVDYFRIDVLNRLAGNTPARGVSKLGDGEVKNPYHFV